MPSIRKADSLAQGPNLEVHQHHMALLKFNIGFLTSNLWSFMQDFDIFLSCNSINIWYLGTKRYVKNSLEITQFFNNSIYHFNIG